jgi:hypothetical protein
MSFIQQLQNFSGNAPLNRRRALLGLSLLALTACSRPGGEKQGSNGVAYYTCTMHPFVRSQDPKGKCPVCGMDLVPVLAVSDSHADATNVGPVRAESNGTVHITPERMQEIGVTTEVVAKRNLTRSFRAPGEVIANPSGAQGDDLWIAAHFTDEQKPIVGQKVMVSVPSLSAQKMAGEVRFVDPEKDRRIPVRIVVHVKGSGYQPGLFAAVSGETSVGERLAISPEAVMPTGTKYIVFVDHGGGRLEPREIEVGVQTDDGCEVISGLSEGDRVVSSANFLIDAESRIQGVLKTWGDRP